jgi:hypothetical protein
MKRFVILSHDWPSPHFDLLIEAEGLLRAWRLPAPPERGRTLLAQANADHRLHYLEYEGPISGDRGSVSAWDRGTYTGTMAGPAWCLHLEGSRLRGRLRLSAESAHTWRVTFEPQEDIACAATGD